MTPSEAGFVVISRFRVANGMDGEVAEAFRNRPHLVDGAPGFVRMEVFTPTEDEAEFWLLTIWTDEQSYVTWHKGHTYRDSHKQIPHGLKLDSSVTEIRTFRHLST